MKFAYRYLPLSKVTPGMELADDLLDKMGHVLLPSGTALTQGMINSIGHHDIHQLSIRIDQISTEDLLEEKTKRLARIEQIFRHTTDTEPVRLLKRYITQYRESETL